MRGVVAELIAAGRGYFRRSSSRAKAYMSTADPAAEVFFSGTLIHFQRGKPQRLAACVAH